MNLSVLVAQFPVTFDIKENLDVILKILRNAKENDLVVFPEGSISGYDTDLSFLDTIDNSQVVNALDLLKDEAINRKIHLWVGTCLCEKGKWYNAAFGFSPLGNVYRYNKVNLATHERGIFAYGSELKPFALKFDNQTVNVGVQLCRDLKYPEQWKWLAQRKTQIFLHLINARGDATEQPIWKSQLISRATENQRFIISVNTASQEQKCPTIVINPKGTILREVISDKTHFFHVNTDLDLISNWYLEQSRTDLIDIKYKR